MRAPRFESISPCDTALFPELGLLMVVYTHLRSYALRWASKNLGIGRNQRGSGSEAC